MVFKEENVLRQLIHTFHVNINYLVQVTIMVMEQAFIVFRSTIWRFVIKFACNVCVIEALSPAIQEYFFFLIHTLSLHDIEEELMEEEMDMESQWEMIIGNILLSWHISKLVHIMSKS